MRSFIFSVLLFIPFQMMGQGAVGSWEDHLPYNSIKKIIEGDGNLYAATDYALAVYNLQYMEIQKLSTVKGLSECGISTIGYSENHKTLVIAYNSTNIDLYKNKTITNVPDIFDKYIPGRKSINSIITNGNYAYIASSFGIVILDLEKLEINDTWKPSLTSNVAEVFDIAISENIIYACTDEGTLSADITNPGLAYFGNWIPVPGLDQNAIYKNIEVAGDNIFLSRQSSGSEVDSLLLLNQGNISILSANEGQSVYSISSSQNKIIVTYGPKIDIYDNEGDHIREIQNYQWGESDSRDAVIANGVLYIADNLHGIVIEHNTSSYESVIIPGPQSVNSENIYSEEGSIYIAGGKITEGWDNAWTIFQTSIFRDRRWKSFEYDNSWDVLRVRPFPQNSSTIYVSTWGSGLYVLNEQGISEHFDDSNSPLESAIPGSAYIRICGMAFDKNNYLWLTHTGVQNSIKILKPDNSWIVLPYTINAPVIGDIIISRSGKKWIVLPGGNGLFVLDDNGTTENFGDDNYLLLDVHDQYGQKLNTIYSIAEDLDGNIWIGTDKGPAIYYNPELVFAEDIYCHRIKIPRDDGSGLADYLLSTEKIKSISIDGGNRKWLGTSKSGVFLVSEDGKTLIKSYSEANSPLLSDTITSIDVNDITGEVWIGTSKGVISVRENATLGDESLNKVYAFPNPVRPEYNGLLTITGLDRNTNVKITDISGNLVFETTSTGGQATWDLNNFRGQRTSTGVYLAFCSSESGETAKVIKILIIR